MCRFGKQFLGLVILSQFVAFKASAVDSVITEESEETENVSFALTSGISETPVDEDSADHVRILFFNLTGAFNLPLPSTSVLKNPRLTVKLGYSDEVDVEDNVTNLENTSVRFTGLGYPLSETWKFTLPISSTIGTNQDDNIYLGYLGTLSLTPGFTYRPAQGALQGASVFIGSTISRSFYRYDASKGGRYNPERAFAPRLGLGYEAGKLSFSALVANTTVYLADGSRRDDTYSSELGVDYEINDHLGLGFSWSQTDRTFGYDGSSTNINFRYADLTLLTLSLTYSI
jgi:hypothetical protein